MPARPDEQKYFAMLEVVSPNLVADADELTLAPAEP
tara:strand:- start:404 stop:511 length:108 start_codon:yes stop_codon:yes gene_type:complete